MVSDDSARKSILKAFVKKDSKCSCWKIFGLFYQSLGAVFTNFMYCDVLVSKLETQSTNIPFCKLLRLPCVCVTLAQVLVIMPHLVVTGIRD